MTQAHKTIGALVELHHSLFEEPLIEHYGHLLNMKGRVLEVIDCDNHITLCRDVESSELLGLHCENFQTIPKHRKIQKKIK